MIKSIFEKINLLSAKKLCFLVVLLNLTFYIAAEYYQYQFCTNNRAEFFLANLEDNKNGYYQPFKGFVVLLDKCSKDPNCSFRQLYSPDDVGNGLVFWTSNKLIPVSKLNGEDVFKFRDPRNYPVLAQIFFIFIHFLVLIIFSFFGNKTLGNVTTLLMAASLCFFDNFFFLTYSHDAYLFPIYVLILCLPLLRPEKFNLKTFIWSGLLIGFFCWFRSSSWPLFLLSSFIVAYSFYVKKDWKIFSKIVTFALLGMLIFKLPSFYFKNSSHAFWHSMHAGLYQYGGVRDKNQKMIPIPLLSKSFKFEKDTFAIFGWADQIQYQTVQMHNPEIKIYSKEYEEYLKQDYFKLIKSAPWQAFVFYMKRIPRIFSFFPFKEHLVFTASNGDVMYQAKIINHYTPYWFSSIFLIVLICFLRSPYINKRTKYLFMVFLATSSIPGFLVHPGYISYTAPVLFCQWLIIFHFFANRINRHSSICNSISSPLA